MAGYKKWNVVPTGIDPAKVNTPEVTALGEEILAKCRDVQIEALYQEFRASGALLVDARDEKRFSLVRNNDNSKEGNQTHFDVYDELYRSLAKGSGVTVAIPPAFSIVLAKSGEPLIRRFQMYHQGSRLGFSFDLVSATCIEDSRANSMVLRKKKIII